MSPLGDSSPVMKQFLVFEISRVSSLLGKQTPTYAAQVAGPAPGFHCGNSDGGADASRLYLYHIMRNPCPYRGLDWVS